MWYHYPMEQKPAERLNPLNDYLLLKMDRGIQKAEARVAHISKDKEALRAYEMRQMALSDWTSGINYARREGIKTGEKQKTVEIARNLKAIGVPFGQIAQGTGLTEAQIREL
jgi:predicted transposase/invertase (TIGR01784 family)